MLLRIYLCYSSAIMADPVYAVELESLFMALADKTRLRLLNLMHGGEVSVGDFTEALGDSQPKISRHLAYLRSSGLVNTRRDGKWIHYSIRWPQDEGMFRVLKQTIDAMERDPEMASDQARYAQLDHPESTPEPIISAKPDISIRRDAHNELEEFLL